jgi:peptide chain release factor 1
MIDWTGLRSEYDKLQSLLSDPNIEQGQRAKLQKKLSQYSIVLELHNEIVSVESIIKDNKLQASKESSELKELYLEEIETENKKLCDLNKQLDDLLYPQDERDKKSVFLEIRSGAGGQEAALFASDLCRMYLNYAIYKNWTTSIIDSNSTDIGGYSKVIIHIKGKNAYKHLKFESGVHRVQRVPRTETAGRVHTSTVTVAVLPEVNEVEISINPQDLRIDVYRASGAGGQHVNTTDSAVRITHIPTGTVVTCQDERSQIKNKAKAMKELLARIYQVEQERKDAEMSKKRKQQVGTGERSEKIRTYNFPQNRITDHRVGLTLKKLDIIMEGNIADLLTPLMEWDLSQRRLKGNFLEEQS